MDLLLLGMLSNLLLVLCDALLLCLGSALLEGLEVAFALESHGGDQALNRASVRCSQVDYTSRMQGRAVAHLDLG